MGLVSDYLTEKFVNKHKSCGGCQNRWNGMQNNMGLKNPPNFLVQQAEDNDNAKKIMDTLYAAKTKATQQNIKRRTR